MAGRSGRHDVIGSSRRKRRSPQLFARWTFSLLVAIVAGKVAFSFGERVMMLAHEAREQRQAIAALRAETERLEQQNKLLKEQVDQLRTPSGIILEARKQGYGFPGEKVLVLPSAEQNTP